MQYDERDYCALHCDDCNATVITPIPKTENLYGKQLCRLNAREIMRHQNACNCPETAPCTIIRCAITIFDGPHNSIAGFGVDYLFVCPEEKCGTYISHCRFNSGGNNTLSNYEFMYLSNKLKE